MKKRSIVVLTLSLAAVAASPALAADPLLTPSITPFTPAPKPMLEVEGVAYYGTLRVPPAYIGNSPGVFMFFKSMDRMFYDIGEKQNLAAEQPAKVKELQGLYAAWNAEQKDPLWRPNPAAKKAKQAKKAAKAAKAAAGK